ncbi:MAG: DUF3307 domain-containing protein [Proteobacteria bacterium]|nr:DUF3307 domain-containing protein [Pseudomonadota bacterium]MBU1740838.1 DUF3307 domain-containing protein [Pseudomonadota bacterium]
MNWDLLIRLGLAHFLADVVINPRALARRKRGGTVYARSLALALHAGLNGLAALLFVFDFSRRGWLIAGITFVTHILIDAARRQVSKRLIPGAAEDVSKLRALKILVDPQSAPAESWWERNARTWAALALADQGAHGVVMLTLSFCF